MRLVNLKQIEVTVLADHTPRHDGLVVHRTRITPDEHEIRELNGLRVASPSVALVEAAARETDRELDRLVAELARRRLLDLDQIDAAIARRAGLRGLRRLRAALTRYRPPTGDPAENASALEREFAAWLTEHPGSHRRSATPASVRGSSTSTGRLSNSSSRPTASSTTARRRNWSGTG